MLGNDRSIELLVCSHEMVVTNNAGRGSKGVAAPSGLLMGEQREQSDQFQKNLFDNHLYKRCYLLPINKYFCSSQFLTLVLE